MGFLQQERESFESLNEMKFCNVGAAIGVAVGIGGSMLLGGDSPSVPDTNPGMIANAQASKEVADIQAKTSREYLDFYKQQYNEMKPILAQVTQSQLATEASNRARADDYAAYERQTFRPLEQSLVDQARNFNTEARREQLAREASADVSQAFGVGRGQLNRQLAASGIRPDSNRFAALNNNLIISEALAKAGAQNKARTDAENLGFARQMDATALGRGLASNASTAYGVSLNAGNSALNNNINATNMMGQGYGGALSGLGGAASSYGTSGNIYGQEFANRMTGYNAQVSAQNARTQALGSMLGTAGGIYAAKYLADGGDVHQGAGPVRGPGGPVDDKIPAMLSNGEYVLPADTVKAIGKDKLDKVVKKTHTPAAEQRKRAALKGKKNG